MIHKLYLFVERMPSPNLCVLYVLFLYSAVYESPKYIVFHDNLMTPNIKACETFCDLMLLQKHFIKDMAKLSPYHQTSSTEGFHSLILRFAPKSVVFPFMGIMSRSAFILSLLYQMVYVNSYY